MIKIKALEEKILKDGKVLPGEVLKVGSFLNHMVDSKFVYEMGKEIARLYKDSEINKIVTIESSGIPIAYAAALEIGVPFVFAKKSKTINVSGEVYSAKVYSYTQQAEKTIIISKELLNKEDKVLIIDDFLAVGNALKGLISICEQSGAEIVGCAIAIEKVFQNGGNLIRESGIRVESLAKIASFTEDSLTFCD